MGSHPSKLYQILEEKFPDTEFTATARKTFNDQAGLELVRQYSVPSHLATLEMELADKYYVLCALSALFSFVDATHQVSFARHSLWFRFERPGDCMMVDAVTVKNLELVQAIDAQSSSDLCLFSVMNQTKSKMGGTRLVHA